MQIILLSGGSGKRLWPLSNGTRSKQFLRLLPAPSGEKESMVQRVVRQIDEAGLNAKITVATSESQRDAIIAHLGETVEIVTEPERRDTFPAIALASAYLSKEKGLHDNEIVVVMPCDPFTEIAYFKTIEGMAVEVEKGLADLVLMGIRPTNPSSKFGYIVPRKENTSLIDNFTEKPNRERAEELLRLGAVWNGGVFAFRLGYIRAIYERYLKADNFKDFRNCYNELPKISFDYEVVEKATSVGVVYFNGEWKDLGTWDSLSKELLESSIGKATEKDCENTTIINELNIPIVCQGVKDLIVAISPDGLLVADKSESEHIKDTVNELDSSVNYKEYGWGNIRIIETRSYEDKKVTTSILTLNSGNECFLTTAHDLTITTLNGSGKLLIEDTEKPIKPGDSLEIKAESSFVIIPSEDLEVLKIEYKYYD